MCYRYIVIPLFPYGQHLDILKSTFAFNEVGRVEFFYTLPDYKFFRLGSVIRYWQVPALVIGRLKDGSNSIKWWKPFRHFNFQEVPF